MAWPIEMMLLGVGGGRKVEAEVEEAIFTQIDRFCNKCRKEYHTKQQFCSYDNNITGQAYMYQKN
jgi:hypothetical protein